MLAPLGISSYRRIVVLTGAGISVPSGLRAYRGPGGLWAEYPELASLATTEAAARDPWSTWRAFCAMRPDVVTAAPNAAHRALADAERRLPPESELVVITQNVDGLHQRAGSSRVIELHGGVLRTRCSTPGCDAAVFDDDTMPTSLPRCSRCGAALRPDVVLFDEAIPARADWESKRALRDCDLFVAIGTSGTVFPAAAFVRSAEYAGARTVFVNLTPLESGDHLFSESHIAPAEQAVPALFR